MPNPTLEVRDLTVRVRLRTGASATVVDKVSFKIPPGGAMGLVGESGCGKTMTSLSITGLLPRVASVDSGQILLEGDDLVTKSQSELRKLRGKVMSMVLQDPMTALDPCYTVRSQLSEPLQQHRKLRGSALDAGLVEALEQVHLSAAKDRLNQYPHQLSGGMRQRVTSAIALAGRPSLLIADEPTTALDVTTQARYLGLLAELREQFGFALLLISHDLLVVRHVCEEVAVMYGGRIVEQGPTKTVFESPQHPYTRALLGAIPVLGDGVHLESIEGQAPDLYESLPGCNFAPRCKFARDVCRDGRPPELLPHPSGQSVRCFGTEPGGWIESPSTTSRAAVAGQSGRRVTA